MNEFNKILVLVLFTLVSCSGNQQQDEVKYITDENGQVIPLGGTLIYGSTADVNSLNPYSGIYALERKLSQLMFLSLMQINTDLETYSPELAKSWEFSEDRTELTFYLRNDVHWSDGVKTTAHDVVFSNDVARDRQVSWKNIVLKRMIENVVALDDTTVVFHFSQAYPEQLFDANAGPIVPKHLLQDVPRTEMLSASFNTNPLGNGPFQLKNWRSQEQIEFVRNPAYYKPNKPYLERIVVKIVPDGTTLLTQLKIGAIDFLEYVSPKDFQNLKLDFAQDKSKIQPYTYEGRSYSFIAWNTIDGNVFDPKVHTTVELLREIPHRLFADVEVRRAMSMAIDRELIREAIGYGMFVPMTGAISPILWAHDPTLKDLPHNPDSARQILQEQGWIDQDGDGIREKNGVDFRFTMKTSTGGGEETIILIQDMLKQVGVLLDIRLEEPFTFFSNLGKKNFDAALLARSGDLKVDLGSLFHSESAFGNNFTAYRNPEFDRLNELAKKTMERDRALELWREVQKILIEDQPYTWLYYRKAGSGLHQRFQDVIMDRRGAWVNLDEWWVPAAQRKYWMPNP
ncbi:MAG: hypothetical protein GF372_12645 [Candidatus Marinimicrobia bacterium]|nr:hypothetical protein [Candidatus Neomarinimicrobiota bacterium]